MAELEKLNLWDRSRDRSILQIYDMETGGVETVAEFDYLIEAPNWSPDGKFLAYNSEGRIYRFDLETKESTLVETDFVGN